MAGNNHLAPGSILASLVNPTDAEETMAQDLKEEQSTSSGPDSTGPDLAHGIPEQQLPDGGKLVGRVGDDEVLLIRRGSDVFAIGAHCTHYHGPLADGLVVGETVRCPWHH